MGSSKRDQLLLNGRCFLVGREEIQEFIVIQKTNRKKAEKLGEATQPRLAQRESEMFGVKLPKNFETSPKPSVFGSEVSTNQSSFASAATAENFVAPESLNRGKLAIWSLNSVINNLSVDLEKTKQETEKALGTKEELLIILSCARDQDQMLRQRIISLQGLICSESSLASSEQMASKSKTSQPLGVFSDQNRRTSMSIEPDDKNRQNSSSRQIWNKIFGFFA